MKGDIFDYPTRYLVESESRAQGSKVDMEGEPTSYMVNLTDPEFIVGGKYNGSCNCRHFRCTLAGRLRNPLNTFIYRCKHINFAREALVDFMLPRLQEADPNIPEEHQT